MLKKAPLLSVAIVMAGVLAGCGTTSTGSNTSSGSKGATVGVMLLEGDTYFTAVGKGVKQANAGETIVTNYEGDAGKESKAIDNMMSRGAKAVVTSPLDPKASATALKRASQDGIKVVCYNTCLDKKLQEGTVSAFVLSDQAGMGKQTGEFAAKYIKAHITGPISIGVLNCDAFDICRLRKDAFFAALKAAGINYKVVAQDQQLVVDKAVPAAEDMLTAHPEINVMWGANDGATAGLVRAVDSSGAKGKVVVFGSDMTPVLAKDLLAPNPTLLTTTGQDGLATGKRAMQVVETLLAGKKVTPFTQTVPVVNYNVDDKKAVQDYLAANK